MENQNDNSTNNTFQQAEVVTPVENKVVEETKKEKKKNLMMVEKRFLQLS